MKAERTATTTTTPTESELAEPIGPAGGVGTLLGVVPLKPTGALEGVAPEVTPLAGVVPEAAVPEAGVVPEAAVPEAGVVPEAAVPEAGVVPEAAVPEVGVRATGQELAV